MGPTWVPWSSKYSICAVTVWLGSGLATTTALVKLLNAGMLGFWRRPPAYLTLARRPWRWIAEVRYGCSGRLGSSGNWALAVAVVPLGVGSSGGETQKATGGTGVGAGAGVSMTAAKRAGAKARAAATRVAAKADLLREERIVRDSFLVEGLESGEAPRGASPPIARKRREPGGAASRRSPFQDQGQNFRHVVSARYEAPDLSIQSRQPATSA